MKKAISYIQVLTILTLSFFLSACGDITHEDYVSADKAGQTIECSTMVNHKDLKNVNRYLFGDNVYKTVGFLNTQLKARHNFTQCKNEIEQYTSKFCKDSVSEVITPGFSFNSQSNKKKLFNHFCSENALTEHIKQLNDTYELPPKEGFFLSIRAGQNNVNLLHLLDLSKSYNSNSLFWTVELKAYSGNEYPSYYKLYFGDEVLANKAIEDITASASKAFIYSDKFTSL